MNRADWQDARRNILEDYNHKRWDLDEQLNYDLNKLDKEYYKQTDVTRDVLWQLGSTPCYHFDIIPNLDWFVILGADLYNLGRNLLYEYRILIKGVG